MIAITKEKFDLRDHINKLEPTQKKGRYICPVCSGNDLTIDQKTGKYQCWHGCSCQDIRETVSPRSELRTNNKSLHHHTRQHTRFQPVPSPQPAPISSGDAVLARLPQNNNDPAGISPQRARPQTNKNPFIPDWLKEQGVPTHAIEIRYWYSQTQWVSRFEWKDPSFPKGYNKTIRQGHIKPDGTTKWTKGNQEWQPYRLAFALEYGKEKWVLGVEGESCVEVARCLQLAAITWQGSAWSAAQLRSGLSQLQSEGVAGLVYWPDFDEAGEKKANALMREAAELKFPLVLLKPTNIWENIPHKGDIADWVKWGQDSGMSESDFVSRLENEFRNEVERRRQLLPATAEVSESEEFSFDDELPDSFNPKAEITQQVLDYLYADQPWICVNDKLYYWDETHYKPSLDVLEIKRLADFLNSLPVVSKAGITYPFAKPSKVKQCLEWVKMRLGVDPSSVNPPGINCTNGVLSINWSNQEPNWQLVPHDPQKYYLYAPVVTYKPDADPQTCDRLLQCLDAPQREIFLRTIAASLDLATVRRFKGRLVRALLLKGDGNNGKDTLREAVAAMYGYQGLAGATLEDFSNYDNGRKFPLARTAGSRVNWASENANFAKLDRIQSLKAFITGDTIQIERKGQDEWDFNPAAVCLFNVNDVPRLDGALEAIQSRYGILSFGRTFKIGADPNKGEIEADPRFKYDPDFLRECVLPAFLNRVLKALVDLMRYGIDYSCTQKALEDIQAHNSHLWQFCQEVGLGYAPGGIIRAGDIWERLKQWYIDNGTLSFEQTNSGKEKALWTEQARKGDFNVKGANQVIARFQALFPKAKRVTVGKGVAALADLDFLPGRPQPDANNDGDLIDLKQEAVKVGTESLETLSREDGEAVTSNGEAVTRQVVSHQALSRADGEPVSPVESVFEKKNDCNFSQTQSIPQIEVEKNQMNGGQLTRLAHPQEPARVSAPPVSPDCLTEETQLAHQPNIARFLGAESVQEQPIDDNNDAAPCAPTWEAELASENRDIEWVRYRGEVYLVAGEDGDLLSLRKAGSPKTVMRVRLEQVEIGGYYIIKTKKIPLT